MHSLLKNIFHTKCSQCTVQRNPGPGDTDNTPDHSNKTAARPTARRPGPRRRWRGMEKVRAVSRSKIRIDRPHRVRSHRRGHRMNLWVRFDSDVASRETTSSLEEVVV